MSDRRELAEKIYVALIANNTEGVSVADLDTVQAEKLAVKAIDFADVFRREYQKRTSEDAKKVRVGTLPV